MFYVITTLIGLIASIGMLIIGFIMFNIPLILIGLLFFIINSQTFRFYYKKYAKKLESK
jgi:hypothetical protein